MLSKQKKISFLFMAFLVMPILLCGYFLWQQHSIKKEMEEQLEKSQLITISILKKDAQWIKPGKELMINGEMFDIKSIEEKNETLYLKGLYDIAEKKIKQKITLLLNKKSNSGNSPLQKIVTQFFNTIILMDNKTVIPLAFFNNTPKKYFVQDEFIFCCKKEIPTPPPNCI